MSGGTPGDARDLPLTQASSYGALGAGLSFAALPLYVHWPAFAAQATGLSLATLGAVLIAMRCLDAIVDPWLGRVADRALARSRRTTVAVMSLAAGVLAVGFAALFLAPSLSSLPGLAPVVWSVMALGITYLGYSFAQIAHQAWGARLGGDAGYRAQVVGARELFALGGVLAASVVPAWWGWTTTLCLLVVLLAVGLAALSKAPCSAPRLASSQVGVDVRVEAIDRGVFSPLRDRAFRSLLAIHVVAGLASAVPATLVLFFVRDRLGLPRYEGLFLFAYFAAAAASLPLWTRLVDVLGLVQVWAVGMVLAIGVFVFAAMLDTGAAVGFALVCVGSGVALGAQLVAPSALLAGTVQRYGAGQRDEGLWFGWWNLAAKLELALAAGLALPLVEWLGYRSGQRDEASLAALVTVYALVPCALEGAALVMLMRHRGLEREPEARSLLAKENS